MKEAECPLCLETVKKSQNFAMSSLILLGMSRQIGRLRKKTATKNKQMPGLPGFPPNPRSRHNQQLAHIFSSQSTRGSSCAERWQHTGTEMQQL